jgi:hypothetical protein
MLIITGSYKILMATLLSVFVPQNCLNVPNLSSNSTNTNTTFSSLFPTVSPLCSTDYFINTSTTPVLPFIVTVFNLFTLAIFILFYLFEYYREQWCIEYLDIDDAKPHSYLKLELDSYPNIKEKLVKLNYYYYRFSQVLVFINLVNFAVSSALFAGYIDLKSITDIKTITVLVTYFLLIADKLVSVLYQSRKSHLDIIPSSAYMYDPAIYNTIDADYATSLKEARDQLELAKIKNNKA